MHQLVFYVPESHCETVKEAVFAAGAGRYQDYDQCCWQTLGQGQFHPLEGSQPFIGQTHKLETVAEYRVEIICKDDVLAQAIDALKTAHPYEEPAYSFWRINHNE